MKNTVIKLGFYLLILTLFIILLISYLSTPKINLEEEKVKEENFQKYIKTRIEKKNKETKDYITGHFEPSLRKDFVKVPAIYNISGYDTYLRKETMEAFARMARRAKVDGITLKIASATRNFNYQKNLWDRKWTGYTLVEGKDLSKSIPNGLERFKKILEYSAVPGMSRHHLGTDIDINNANTEYFETTEGMKVYNWLSTRGPIFGFCQPYTKKDNLRTTGHNEEKWHWSYLPLARFYTHEYKKLISEKDITGFYGEEFIEEQDLINEYVLGINPDCL